MTDPTPTPKRPLDRDAILVDDRPRVTHPHTRALRYRPGDRVLLEATMSGQPVVGSPWLGVVVAADGRTVTVQDQHQKDGEHSTYIRRGGLVQGSSTGGPSVRLIGRADEPAGPLPSGDYLVMQQQLFALAVAVDRMPLDRFLVTLQRGQALGPVLDPSKFNEAKDTLAGLERLARSLQSFQAEARDLATLPTPDAP